jgi:PAS domain S-box-containing protein
MEDKLESLNVLVVEDNPDDKIFLEYHLKRVRQRELTVAWRETLSAGLTVIAGGWPDIVFLDLSLPDSRGIETVRTVRAQAPSLSIVVLTGMDDDEVALDAIKIGAQDYLVKGQLSHSVLSRSINYAIERQRAASVTQWFSAVLESASFAIVGKSLQNRILSWNYGAEKIFGYSPAEIINQPIGKLLCRTGALNQGADDCPTIQGHDCEYAECIAYRKDGTGIFVSFTISPIRNLAGAVTASSMLVRDVTSEKRLQTALRETDERLSLAVSAAKLGLWDLRNDKLYWNDTMYALMGLDTSNGAPTLEIFLSRINAEDRKRIEQALTTIGTFDLDLRMGDDCSNRRYIAFKGNVVESEETRKKEISGVCFDITEKKLAEQALLSSERTLRIALESAGMGAWSYDFQTKKTSRSALHDQIYGYEHILEEWTYDILMDRTLPEDREALRQISKELRSQMKFNVEYRIRHARDNSVRWLRTQGELIANAGAEPDCVIGTVKDITESKRLEQLLQDAQQRRDQILHNIVQHAPIGVAILDSELRITDGNSAFGLMIGQELRQLINRPIVDMIPINQRIDIEAMGRTGAPIQVSHLKVNAHTSERADKYWDLSVWPIMSRGQKMSGGVLLTIDRTQTILLERQREDFLAAIAHDIKNPLIGASRVLGLLCSQKKFQEDETTFSLLRALRDSNESLLALVQNLVDICRYETLSYPCCFDTVHLENLLQSCLEQIQYLAESANVTVEAKIEKRVAGIQADAIALRRVLMNILHNAIKFNRKGGTLKIELNQTADITQIRVSNTGDGISDSDRVRLFQRFSQGIEGRKYTSGSGLGLYISKQIIDAHGGQISCESELGESTTFTLSLPNDAMEKMAQTLAPQERLAAS